MSERTVARRYAEALFKVAEGQGQGQPEAWATQLAGVLAVLEDNAGLKRVFYHLLVPAGDKKEVAREVFGQRLQPEVLNFLFLVLEKRRERYLEKIYQEYNRLVQRAQGLIEGMVLSAFPLLSGDLKALEEKLSAASSRKVQLKAQVDRSLIGGLVVYLGDRIYDGSLSGRLTRLRERLVAGDK